MAVLKGLIRKMAGSVGDFTFKQVNGQTVVSEKVTEVANPRTDAQMKVRCRWRNISNTYSGIKPLLNYGFENKAKGLSDFNMFMKVNMQRTPVYLTKEQANGGACVAADYQITQGSLPSIVTDKETGWNAVTDIAIGSMEIDSETTIGDFSKAVVNNNSQYKYGDQISYFTVVQNVNETTGIPYCDFKAYAVVLDAASTDKLWDKVLKNGFYAQNGYIGHGPTEGDFCYAWVHSRKSNSKTLVSSQSLIQNNTKLADYQTDSAYTAAASSYGTSTSVFLTPGSESASSSSASDSGSGSSGSSSDDQSI